MSTQFDFNPGLDLSSLSSATLAQVVQAVSQISPLSNIGGVIVGTTTPDVANNPRFIRYLWIDITDVNNPLVKRYTGSRSAPYAGSWAVIGVAANAITTTMIDDIADRTVNDANGGVDIGRLKLNADGTPTAGDALKLLRVESNGRYVEVVSLANILTAGVVPLTALSNTGGTNYYILSVNGGAISWTAFDPTNMIAANSVALSKLAIPSVADAYKVAAINAAGAAVEYSYEKVIQRIRSYSTLQRTISATLASDATPSASSGTRVDELVIAITPRAPSASKFRVKAFFQGYHNNSGIGYLSAILTWGANFKYMGGVALSTNAAVANAHAMFQTEITPDYGVSNSINIRLATNSAAYYINSRNTTPDICFNGTPEMWMEVEEVI